MATMRVSERTRMLQVADEAARELPWHELKLLCARMGKVRMNLTVPEALGGEKASRGEARLFETMVVLAASQRGVLALRDDYGESIIFEDWPAVDYADPFRDA